MAKVLLKHVGTKSSKKYQKDVARISKTAIAIKAANISKIEMYSRQESFSNTTGKSIGN